MARSSSAQKPQEPIPGEQVLFRGTFKKGLDSVNELTDLQVLDPILQEAFP